MDYPRAQTYTKKDTHTHMHTCAQRTRQGSIEIKDQPTVNIIDDNKMNHKQQQHHWWYCYLLLMGRPNPALHKENTK